jgi:hypothetical protein
MTGAITVANGGSLAFANDTLVYSSGRINYASGSSGSLSSQTTSTYIPKGAVTFPSTTTIAIDFSKVWGGLLPDGWTLCQSACNGTTKTIHAEDLTTTPKVPATYVYIEWDRLDNTENKFIGSGGRAPEGGSPYDPGQWLAVTGVDTTTKIVTLTLPTVGPTSGFDNWFTCAECLNNGGSPGGGNGASLRNETGATGRFQLLNSASAAGTFANNENKKRYELRNYTTFSPFNADHEFEGFLGCITGTDSCARFVKTETDAHDTTGETMVIWKDPAIMGAKASSILDVYYAKPRSGDHITFVNPTVFKMNGTGSFLVSSGSTMCISSPCVGIVAQRPKANAQSVDIQQGGLEFQGLNGTSVDLVLVEHLAGTTPVAGHLLPNVAVGFTNMTTGGNLAGTTTLHVSRVTTRFPDITVSTWPATNVAGTDVVAEGVTYVQDDGSGRWGGGSPTTWTDVGFRKIRIEAFDYGFGSTKAGKMSNCWGGMLLQDYLYLNARNNKTIDQYHSGGDWLEAGGEQVGGCDYDRIAASGPTIGGGVVRSTSGNPVKFTSLVAFGFTGLDGASDPASGTSSVFVSPVIGDGGSTTDAVHNAARLYNWMTDGFVSRMSSYYGAFTDWFIDWPPLPGVLACGDNVGIFSIGGTGSNNSPISCSPSRGINLIDTYLGGTVKHNNYIDADYVYLFVWSAFSTKPAVGSIPAFSIDGLFWSNVEGSDYEQVLANFTDTAAVSFGMSIRNSTFIAAKSNAASRIILDDPDANEGITSLALNNVFFTNLSASASTITIKGVNTEVCSCSGSICTPVVGCNTSGDTILAGASDLVTSTSTGSITSGNSNRPIGYTTSAESGSDPTTAMPRYAGPIVYDWPFAWATVDPVPGFRRTTPRREYIPKILRDRMQGSTSWIPKEF